MPTTIDQLQIEIESKSDGAIKGLERLKSTLSSLKKISESSGLDMVHDKLEKISQLNFSNLNSLKKLSSITSDIDKATEKVESLTSSASQVPAAISTTVDVGGTQNAVSEVTRVTDAVLEVPKAVSIAVSTPGAVKATSKIGAFRRIMDLAKQTAVGFGSSMKSFGKSIRQIGRIVLVYGMAFRAFSAITRGISDGLKNLAGYSSATNANLSQLSTNALYLKNSLAAALYPIIVALLPVINSLVDGFVRLLNVINQFISAVSGATSYTKAKKYLQSYAETAKSTAEKIKKSFAGMDEITVIGQQDSASSASATPDYSQMFEASPISSTMSSVIDNIKEHMNGFMEFLGGMALGIGAILVFSGANIPLGLGLMVVGAVTLGSAISENWGAMDTTLQDKFASIMVIIGSGAMVVGAILAFSGAATGLGIALMIGGAATMATAVAENWDGMSTNIKNTITEIGIAVGGASLVLGTILAFSGAAIPLGIGLMIMGAAELATSAVLGWDSLPDQVKSTINTISIIVSSALLVLGMIIAAACPSHIPLGIALLALGAAGLVATAAINWNGLSDKTKSTISIITAIVSVALLALGIILIVASAGTLAPLGIALIAAGAAGLAATIAVNWDWVKEKINTVLSAALAIISGFGLVLGILLCLTGAGIPLGIGLIIASLKGVKKASDMDDNPITRFVKNMVNGIIGIFESGVNFIINMLNKLHWDVPDWVPLIGGSSFGFSINPISIPRLKNGGFPDGEDGLFYANHGEMVGQFSNGRTAVANNDQIVEGIASGVAAANSEQNSLLREQNKLLRQLLDKDMVGEINVTTITKAMQRLNRREGKTIATVGI